MKIENLKERIWFLNDEPEFTKSLLIKSNWLSDHINLDDYVIGHAIYLNHENPEIISGFIFKRESQNFVQNNNFLDYLLNFDIKNYLDILFAFDTYNLNVIHSNKKFLKLPYNFKKHGIMDKLLGNSRGAIIWHHQLEELYLFHQNNLSDANEFRKDILKKKASAFKKASAILIDKETTLNDVIKERMIFGSTISPSLKDANKLFQYLNKA